MRLIVALHDVRGHLFLLERGSSLLFWTNTTSQGYPLYPPSRTYMPSLAYSMYLPLAMYMSLAMCTPSSVCSHVFFGILAVLNLGVFAPLIVALRGTFIVACCKQQHEILIVVWESVWSSLALVCSCHCFLWYDNKKWLSRCPLLLLCHCNQYYYWRFALSQLLMRLIHIIHKVGCCLGNLARLLQSTVVAINVTSCNIT